MVSSMMLESMNELITKLEERNVKIKKLYALEMFARAGDWHTTAYAHKVNSLEAWEIDSKWKNDLKKNLPHAKIKITDSIQTIYQNDHLPKFNFIVIDNPQNLYGPKSRGSAPQYCEHFEVIKKIDKLIDRDAIVVFNVNLKPYSYEKLPLWKKRREEFYGTVDTSDMTIEFLTDFYTKLFEEIGFKIIFHINVRRITPNPLEKIYYFAYNLKRRN